MFLPHNIITVQLDKYYSECRYPECNIDYDNLNDIIEELKKRQRLYNNVYDKLNGETNIDDSTIIYNDEVTNTAYTLKSFKAIYEVINLTQSNFINIKGSDFEKTFKENYIVDINNLNKFYIDVENIHSDNPDEFVNELINDFINFVKQNNNYIFKYSYKDGLIGTLQDNEVNSIDTSYVITKNSQSSSHAGLSYHIIFSNIVIENGNYARNILKDFVLHNKKYYGCIDLSVYTKRRLFRLPYNHNCMNYKEQYMSFKDKVKVINEKDVHIPQVKEDNGEIDFSRYIITYVDDIKNKTYYLIMYTNNVDNEYMNYVKEHKSEPNKDSADFNFDDYLRHKLDAIFERKEKNISSAMSRNRTLFKIIETVTNEYSRLVEHMTPEQKEKCTNDTFTYIIRNNLQTKFVDILRDKLKVDEQNDSKDDSQK